MRLIGNEGCSANKIGMGTHKKTASNSNSFELILKQNMKKV